MRHALLIGAAILALAVDGFFALVNFYPMAPEPDRGPPRYVLTSLNEKQTRWFQTNMLDEFNNEHATNFVARSVNRGELVANVARADVALAVLPAVDAEALAAQGQLTPFDSVATAVDIERDYGEVREDVIESAKFQNRQYFLPRAIALDVAVFRISKVRDALLNWQVVRPEIETALRAINGQGLPTGYELDQQPVDWDAYDVFVLAYYWSHRAYGGGHAQPRIMHRAGLSTEAQLDIVANMYRSGMADETLSSRTAPASVDWMQWEALYRREGLYAAEMFEPRGVDDDAILAGITRGDVFFTSVDQLQAFTLHGGSYRGARALVPDGDDLGFAPMPRFASLALGANGAPARTAPPFSFRKEFVWVLPKQSAAKDHAYALAAWIIEREDHARECEALGILPMRTDVIRERETLFREPWMQDVLEAGLDQWERAQEPSSTLLNGFGVDHAVNWHRIVAATPLPPSDASALTAAMQAPVDREANLRAFAALPRASGDDHEADEAAAEAAFALPPLREPMVLEGLARDAGIDLDAATTGGTP